MSVRRANPERSRKVVTLEWLAPSSASVRQVSTPEWSRRPRQPSPTAVAHAASCSYAGS